MDQEVSMLMALGTVKILPSWPRREHQQDEHEIEGVFVENLHESVFHEDSLFVTPRWRIS
jgi:hypothetical protein